MTIAEREEYVSFPMNVSSTGNSQNGRRACHPKTPASRKRAYFRASLYAAFAFFQRYFSAASCPLALKYSVTMRCTVA